MERTAQVAILLVASLFSVATAAVTKPPCSRDYVGAIMRLFDPPVRHAPLLSKHQMLWITSILEATQSMYPDKPVNYLVFGLGLDTPGWLQVNCRGRTVFLEHSADWVKQVTINIARDYNSTMESYTVAYKGNMSKPDEFFQKPWLMTMPQTVSNTCFDVILVDAPTGYNPRQNQPGRMESTYWAVHQSQQCLAKGKLKVAHIFLHDVERELEKKIMAKYLTPEHGVMHLGTLKGWRGLMAGYTVMPPNATTTMLKPSR